MKVKVVLRVMRIILSHVTEIKTHRGFSSTQEIDLITGNKLNRQTHTCTLTNSAQMYMETYR